MKESQDELAGSLTDVRAQLYTTSGALRSLRGPGRTGGLKSVLHCDEARLPSTGELSSPALSAPATPDVFPFGNPQRLFQVKCYTADAVIIQDRLQNAGGLFYFKRKR